jgi:hypothetical protein
MTGINRPQPTANVSRNAALRDNTASSILFVSCFVFISRSSDAGAKNE